MKTALIASFVIHLAGLAVLPSAAPVPPPTAESVSASCRCDYELTITDGRPPHALTLGQAPTLAPARSR